MSEVANQIFIFLMCLLSGLISGILYDAFFIVKKIFKLKILHITADVTFFICFSAIFVFMAVLFELPQTRAYMIIASLLGLLLYVKSFHIIVAFLFKMLYNVIVKKRYRLKGDSDDRRKT